ncbi:MAG: fibronectin type III domain-containing protein [Ruminococcus sp.]|nr:fibronectin type III domain-containing protein [Ruminococcus sp.]
MKKKYGHGAKIIVSSFAMFILLTCLVNCKLSTHAISADVESFFVFTAADSCEHDYMIQRYEPSCTMDGSVIYTCTKCGDYYITRLESLGHDMSLLIERVEPICDASGYDIFKCSRCEVTERNDYVPKGHVESEWITDVEPGCATYGHKYTFCLVCGETIHVSELVPAGHKYDMIRILPSCTSDGVDVYTCSDCNETYSVVTAAKVGHEMSGWSTEKKATCTVNGKKSRKCKRCDFIEYAEIPAQGHTQSKWITDKAADCVTDGYRHADCTVCGATLKAEKLPAKGHDIIIDKAVAVTCTANGKTEGSHCKTCKAVLKKQTVIKAKGHNLKQSKTAATTSKNGKIASVCSVCKQDVKSTVIAKIASVKLAATSYVYDNKAKTPEAIVKDSNGKVLQRSIDYTVKYESGRKAIGIYSVKVTFKGNYSGTKTLTFKILPGKTNALSVTGTTTTVKLTWAKVSGASGYRVYKYDTKNKKYVKLCDTTKTNYTVSGLKAGTAYKFAVKAYGKSGKTTYFSSSYKEISTSTQPTAPKLKASAGKGKASLSWNKISGADGYVIYMSTSKNGTYKQIATIKKAATLKYTKSGLSKGKTYYFKIRAYKTVGKTNIYSAYSSVASVKIK